LSTMDDLVTATLLARVYDVAVETPLEIAPHLSAMLANRLYLKREDTQPVHSFKLRGAYNKMAHLRPAERGKGVITASAGNHAQGVALAAQKLGISALIVMPETTPDIKVAAVRNMGAEIVLSGDNYSEAYAQCMDLARQTGRSLIHPFDDPLVIAGQGTIGREILEQLPDTTHIFVPVGGGGLLAGIAAYTKSLRPDVKIIGVEPDDSNAMQASLRAGKRVMLPHVGIFADGVAVKQVGQHTFRLARKYVDEIITVNTDRVCAAIKSIFAETRSIMEPAGALAVAGAEAYAKRHGLKDKYLVSICSGANMTFERLQFIAERTLIGSGREALFAVSLQERPGALHHFCDHIVKGHGISEFSYRLYRRDRAHILAGITISGGKDKQRFIQKMVSHGYEYADLSDDELTKEHIRHMIGGISPESDHEHLYTINFPERPGALNAFLQATGDRWNISLFHYRGPGGDTGRVLIGFESADKKQLESRLRMSGYEFEPVSSAAARIFLSAD
jgi:threonine dehydratase